jgi:hypothetical protein
VLVTGHAPGSWGRSQRPARSDCLLKTQVRAKSQDDVYGLTPARCWNVKGTGQPARAKLRTQAPVNGGGNYNHPKVAKFLVG